MVLDALEILSKILASMFWWIRNKALLYLFIASLCIVLCASIQLSPSSWYPFYTISSTSWNRNNTFICMLHRSQFLPSRICKFLGNTPLPVMIVASTVEGRRCNDRNDKMEKEYVISHSKFHKQISHDLALTHSWSHTLSLGSSKGFDTNLIEQDSFIQCLDRMMKDECYWIFRWTKVPNFTL